jgi:hypothetical protein
MPHLRTVFGGLAARPDFAAAYAEAKKIAADLLFEEMYEQALTATPLTTQCERFKWDARRFHVSKLNPKRAAAQKI